MGMGAAFAAAAANVRRMQTAETMPEDSEEKEVRVSWEQWTELNEGAGYTAAGKTVDELKPGFYDITVVDGRIIWLPVRARQDKLIRFPDSKTDIVLSEIEKFWKREQSFIDHDLPYKRGILMWGPPGSGKSCTVRLLAEQVVERGGIVIMFPNPETFVGAFRQLRDIQPDTPVVVMMEDLDAIIERQNESKILNLLDGTEDVHKCLFVATTNYPEKLGPRIVNRPSRFDRRIKIGHPGPASRKMYLDTLILEGDLPLTAEQHGKAIEVGVEKMVNDSEGWSLAHLKELFVATIILDADYVETVRILDKMKDKVASTYDEDGDMPGQYV